MNLRNTIVGIAIIREAGRKPGSGNTIVSDDN